MLFYIMNLTRIGLLKKHYFNPFHKQMFINNISQINPTTGDIGELPDHILARMVYDLYKSSKKCQITRNTKIYENSQ